MNMANEDSATNTNKQSNLKVPPLKIVLNSHQNNAVVNITSSSNTADEQMKSSEKEEKITDRQENEKELTESDEIFERNQKKNSKNVLETDARQNNSDDTGSKELALNANQRITRSSQRAAQQNKTETSSETNGEDGPSSEAQERIYESARKAKRRKVEPQESDLDAGQSIPEPTLTMADIYPADYQLPTQNSFELYRDIRKRPYKKLMKLNYIQPRVPYGFRDYRLSAGPYLLDGNKLGVGLNGARLENLNNNNIQAPSADAQAISRLPLRMKFLNLHQKLSSNQQARSKQHTSYTIPKISEAPKSLLVGSPLHELFQDQERARHQMRIQHLKERERSILAAEQEMLRAYNKAAIADVKQKLHLSACTYFYYQERYHYLDEQSSSTESPSMTSNETTQIQDEELKDFNKEVFLNHLQEIDDKWDKIKRDMLVRHRNESDSLYAVQSLEWEWKAKEIGACDVRVSLKIEPEFVPRVEIAPLDY